MTTQSQEAVQTDRVSATNATVGTSSAVLVAANEARVGVLIYNNGAATIYLDNSTATVAGSFPVPAGTAFEEREYTGAIHAISTLAAQDVRIWETG